MTRRGVGETNVFPNCLITYSNANLLKLFGGNCRPCRSTIRFHRSEVLRVGIGRFS